jgi:hypothetical protein
MKNKKKQKQKRRKKKGRKKLKKTIDWKKRKKIWRKKRKKSKKRWLRKKKKTIDWKELMTLHDTEERNTKMWVDKNEIVCEIGGTIERKASKHA